MGSDEGGELVFRAALHRRLPGGRERPIITTEDMRPDWDEERVRNRSRVGSDRKWWLMIQVVFIVWLGMFNQTVAEDVLARIQETSGSFHYRDEGDVYLKAGTGTIKVDLECGELIEGLETFNRVAGKAGGLAKWIALSSEHDRVELQRAIGFFQVKKEEAESRLSERNVGVLADIYNFFTGLWNKARISDIETRLDNQEEAGRAEVHEVEGIRRFMAELWKTTNASEQVLGKTIEVLGARGKKEHLQRLIVEEFAMINSNATAVTRILRAATSHKIDPSLADIVDFEEAWLDMGRKLKKTGQRLPGDTWQHVFSQDCDVFARGQTVTIAVHFPIRLATAQKMTSHKWIPSPMLMDNNLIVIEGDQKVFATDQNDGVAVIGAAADCLWYGRTRFCRGPVVIERKGFHTTCVSAVWNMDIQHIRQLCEMKLIPIREMIMPITSNVYQVVAEKTMPIKIQCQDGKSMAKRIDRGMKEVKVKPGCDLQTSFWDATEGRGMGAQITKIKHTDEDLDELAKVLNGSWTEEQLGVLEQLSEVDEPTPVASMKASILAHLKARGSATQKFYIVIGVVAVIAMAAAAGMAYLWWRNRRIQTLVQGVDAECRQHRQGPPQEPRENGEEQPIRLDLEDQEPVEEPPESGQYRRDMLAQLEETLALAERRLSRMQPEERETHREHMMNSVKKIRDRMGGMWFMKNVSNEEKDLAMNRLNDMIPAAQIAKPTYTLSSEQKDLAMNRLNDMIPAAQAAFIAPDTNVGVVEDIPQVVVG